MTAGKLDSIGRWVPKGFVDPEGPTPPPWPEVEYNNDTGPDDEGFWEWWEIPGIAKFERKEDAEFVLRLVNKTVTR